eukprot:CAMPEP_0170546196 /NCGR_PEP_ID=MMETSP0211-20121228/4573_1 /TAXON_ID=311385 /ORGANISM="Pseudokeronopsis sp., Strain OXSARD2" /LENGTH=72 /DNA_ID=CAMNT_0010850541 /DNA_START=386 /DNA_END=601 /DNA_ORIENTATION=-
MAKHPVQEENRFSEQVIDQYKFLVLYPEEPEQISHEEVEKALLSNKGEQELLAKIEQMKVKGLTKNCKIMCC